MGIKTTKNRSEVRVMLDVNMTLALVKCLSEQIHGMKWDYSQNLKNKFNKMFKVVKAYENEIDRSMIQADEHSIENIYDAMMDSICEAKEIAMEGYEKKDVENKIKKKSKT